jgi:hypothetical protein
LYLNGSGVVTGDDELPVVIEPDDPDGAETLLGLDDRLLLEGRRVDYEHAA